MKSCYASEEGRLSLARNAISTNTNHTTVIDYDSIDAETLLHWVGQDEFIPLELANRLSDRLDNATDAIALNASHWVPEDRPREYVEHLTTFRL